MIQLRPYQLEGLSKVWDYFKTHTGNPVIAWPTGTGKSAVPAVFIKDVMSIWPNQRFLMVTHVKELIAQNAEVLKFVWPNAPLGIHSAGLKQRDYALPIIFGGIQSMIKNPSLFGHRDIIFIDECHLISDNESSQYLTFIATMKLINPDVKVIGMSATPFRMGKGLITDSGLFTDICHDITGMEAFNKLIDEGYISPLIPRRTKTELDISNVGIANGDYIGSQLQAAVDQNSITYAALRETVEAGKDRQSWLIFASGIEHADHIADMLRSFGVECASVHSKQKSEYNDEAINNFKQNRLRAIVNYGKLTTGFNHPNIDLIPMLRPTMSVPLWIQMLGRGTRPADGKQNCLVLDFARNTPRLGPINDPIIPRKKGEKPGEIPVKICEACGVYNHTRAKFCVGCGAEFQFKIKITKTAGTDELIKSDLPIIEEFNVDRVIYSPHNKLGSPTSIKVTYYCGLRAFNEYVCLEHNGIAAKKARDWWRQRHKSDPPKTSFEALQYQAALRVPRKLRVWVNRKWPKVINVEW